MKSTPEKLQEFCSLREMQHSLSSQITEVPLNLEMHEEKKFWRIDVQYGCLEKAECVMYWDTREAAEAVRQKALLSGGIELDVLRNAHGFRVRLPKLKMLRQLRSFWHFELFVSVCHVALSSLKPKTSAGSPSSCSSSPSSPSSPSS